MVLAESIGIKSPPAKWPSCGIEMKQSYMIRLDSVAAIYRRIPILNVDWCILFPDFIVDNE